MVQEKYHFVKMLTFGGYESIKRKQKFKNCFLFFHDETKKTDAHPLMFILQSIFLLLHRSWHQPKS